MVPGRNTRHSPWMGDGRTLQEQLSKAMQEQLPRESREYYVWRFSSADMEVLFLSFTWDGPGEELFEIVEERVKPRLQRVEGVGSVAVWGREPQKVFIDLDDIRTCTNGNTIARLMYVAVSRASQQVYMTGDLVN